MENIPNEVKYFMNKMKYNEQEDLEKSMVVYGKCRTGKTTLKKYIEKYLGVEAKLDLDLPLENIMRFLEEESITHNGYTIYFTNDKNQYKKEDTRVFVELIQQY
jgi:tRNA A37 threonylcarbamoyladenosine biosynthesis protein TsaE